MRSHTESVEVTAGTERRGWLQALVVASALTAFMVAADASGQPRGNEAGRPSDAEVTRALEQVKADPNLATERTIKMLRWKGSQDAVQTRWPAWVLWVVGLFRWIDQSARLLVWITVGGLGVLLVVYLVRLVRAGGGIRVADAFVPPTHVRDLDIRPETLPAEIGAAARALWDRGEHRAALALLYRGMLSRLAHVHRVPIRDSSTEGDCLSMAAKHLTQRKREYAVLLVRVWQGFVYGGEDVDASTVYALCHDFGSALDRASSFEAPAPQSIA